MARPEAKIDLGELEKLATMQCTDDEIAASSTSAVGQSNGDVK